MSWPALTVGVRTVLRIVAAVVLSPMIFFGISQVVDTVVDAIAGPDAGWWWPGEGGILLTGLLFATAADSACLRQASPEERGPGGSPDEGLRPAHGEPGTALSRGDRGEPLREVPRGAGAGGSPTSEQGGLNATGERHVAAGARRRTTDQMLMPRSASQSSGSSGRPSMSPRWIS